MPDSKQCFDCGRRFSDFRRSWADYCSTYCHPVRFARADFSRLGRPGQPRRPARATARQRHRLRDDLLDDFP